MRVNYCSSHEKETYSAENVRLDVHRSPGAVEVVLSQYMSNVGQYNDNGRIYRQRWVEFVCASGVWRSGTILFKEYNLVVET